MDVKFKAYCDCSNLLRASPLVQQQVTLGFVDSNLNSYLSGKVDPKTPLFGVDCHTIEAVRPEPGLLIYYLGEKFKVTHPLSSRRLRLFKMTNQAWTAYFSKWEEAFRNANMEPYLVMNGLAEEPSLDSLLL